MQVLTLDEVAQRLGEEQFATLQEDLHSKINQSHFYSLGDISVFIIRDLRVEKETIDCETAYFIICDGGLWRYVAADNHFIGVRTPNSFAQDTAWDILVE